MARPHLTYILQSLVFGFGAGSRGAKEYLPDVSFKMKLCGTYRALSMLKIRIQPVHRVPLKWRD